RPDELVTVGDELTLLVIRVAQNGGRIGLSLKELAHAIVEVPKEEERGGGRRGRRGGKQRDDYDDDEEYAGPSKRHRRRRPGDLPRGGRDLCRHARGVA